MHESLDDVLHDTPEHDLDGGQTTLAADDEAKEAAHSDAVKAGDATTAAEPGPPTASAPRFGSTGADRSKSGGQHAPPGCIVCGRTDHCGGHCPTRANDVQKDWDAAVLAARAGQNTGATKDERATGTATATVPARRDHDSGRGREASRPTHRSRSRSRDRGRAKHVLATSPPRQWGSKHTATQRRSKSPPRGRWAAEPTGGVGSTRDRGRAIEEPPATRGGRPAPHRTAVVPAQAPFMALQGLNPSVDAMLGEARGLKHAAEAIPGGVDQALLFMSSCLRFMHACAIQEAAVASHVPGGEHQQRKYAAALLFAQTGTLCDHTAGLCDSLLSSSADAATMRAASGTMSPKGRLLLVLRLLMLRLGLINSVRALGLRRDALAIDAAAVLQASGAEGGNPRPLPTEAVQRCAQATRDACTTINAWVDALAVTKVAETAASAASFTDDAAFAEAVAQTQQLTQNGGWGDLTQLLGHADAVAAIIQRRAQELAARQ